MNPALWIAIFGTLAGYVAYQRRQELALAMAAAGAQYAGDAAPPDAFSQNAPSWTQNLVADVESLVGLDAAVSPSMGAYIQAAESFSPTPYLDPAGNSLGQYSIGYGHKIVAGDPYWPAGPATSITPDDAQALFETDLSRAGAAVARLVTVPLSQGQYDAMAEFTYNEGQGHLAGSTLLKKLNAGDYYGAAAEFQKWVYAGGRVLPALQARRAYDAQVFVG